MTTFKENTLAAWLTYAGTLPLIGTVSVICSGYEPELQVVRGAITYSAIIISFLAGIHWATHLFCEKRGIVNLLLASNIVALLSWLSLMVDERPALTIQMICFLSLLAIDLTHFKAGILPRWYITLRRNATIIVVLSLAIIWRTV